MSNHSTSVNIPMMTKDRIVNSLLKSPLMSPEDTKAGQKLDQHVSGHGLTRSWDLRQELCETQAATEGNRYGTTKAPWALASGLIVVNSDSVGDLVTKKATVGQVTFPGSHVVKHSCISQQIIKRSSAENDYMTTSGMLSQLCDLGVHPAVNSQSDSSAWFRVEEKVRPHEARPGLFFGDAGAKCTSHTSGSEKSQVKSAAAIGHEVRSCAACTRGPHMLCDATRMRTHLEKSAEVKA